MAAPDRPLFSPDEVEPGSLDIVVIMVDSSSVSESETTVVSEPVPKLFDLGLGTGGKRAHF